MTPNFDDCHHRSPRPSDAHPSSGRTIDCDAMPETLDNLKRDRFELLSAYLDGEVTADERRQVEGWLATDPGVQKLYSRLLQLRQKLRGLPVPASEQASEDIAAQVVMRLERRPRRTLLWTGMAIAALFVGAVSMVPRNDWLPSMAHRSADEPVSPTATMPDDGLMIALDRPIIQLSKTAVSDTN